MASGAYRNGNHKLAPRPHGSGLKPSSFKSRLPPSHSPGSGDVRRSSPSSLGGPFKDPDGGKWHHAVSLDFAPTFAF